MRAHQGEAVWLAGTVARRRISSALRACGMSASGADIRQCEPAAPSFVASLPPWVASVGALSSAAAHWILCTPDPGAGTKDTALGQIVLNVQPGRYMVEVLDIERTRWIARESATGSPLVTGLPFVAGPMLLRVRRLGSAQDTGGLNG
ncbi:MAG: hypothetical protein IMZ55_15355 [Acidobacteria bacterium]|nr:hypothetical protein [Acidobacteriota bacterium]